MAQNQWPKGEALIRGEEHNNLGNGPYPIDMDNPEARKSADTLARIAGISRYHFFRAFKVHTGKTPYEYLKDIRLEKAAEMLRESSESSITEICLKAGFATHSHFTSVFFRKTGMTPREYRLRHGKRKS